MQEEEMIRKAKELYEAGMSIRKIAQQLNLSYSRARKLLKDAGVQFRGKLPKETEEKIVELGKKGYSANRISKELGVNSNTVLRVLRRYSLVKRKRKLSEANIKVIEEMYKSGASIYKIAKQLKISTNLVVYYLKKLNIYKPTHESYSTSQ
ncbi:MAG: CRISPR repeat-binding protein [Candidatus Aramenus sulfurataquae]|uniref:CRISPR DNA repeat-binding protein Cbp1 n=3 Tax=Candidatus Aramenus sulfurataquae TaxID=1326980 RepID=W7L8Z9_9CREN|nr:MAG: CRISPR repeat-binding protein [Candidatus Aramenus sulfurataquae]MCL7344312.1 CRISPR DNA repeat-binding protein Cbp1 [Candidatus Aramenus sulfurataquae]